MPTSPLSRRQFLALAASGGAAAALAACGGPTAEQPLIGPTDVAVAGAERRRRRPDAAVREVAIGAAPLTIDLGALPASTWG